MADNVVSLPGPRSEGPDVASGSSPEKVVGWPDFKEVVESLPKKFRDPARRLADELRPTGRPATYSESDAGRSISWHQALQPGEVWAVAEAFRRAIESDASGGSTGRDRSGDHTADLHAALDRNLLDAATAALDRSAAAHRRLLEDVSHDIRSPLNSILFLADALRAERSGPLNDVQSRQMGILYTASVTLVRMINDLIDFSRLGARERIRVAATSFSVESVLGDVSSLLGPIVAHRGVALRFGVETEGLRTGDAQLLSRVLLNLVSNAVQAVDEGGQVSIRVDETSRGDLRVEICDDRVGTDVGHLRALITEADAGRIPGETRGWTRGLGLSICARLVKAADGRIRVSSRAGEGTVFTVELPFHRL